MDPTPLKQYGKSLVVNSSQSPEEVLMSAEKQSLLSLGTSVKTVQENHAVVDWTTKASASRLWGVQGEIIARHDSHGLCYGVQHPDGSIGYYHQSELEVVAVKV